MGTAMREGGGTGVFSRRTLWLFGTGIFAVIGATFVAGAYSGYNERAAEPGWAWPLVAMAAVVATGVAFGLWRAWRQPAPPAPSGPGEAAEAAGKRHFWTVLGALFVVGMGVGAGAAVFEIDPGGFLTGRLPPAFAIVAAAVTAVALTVGTLIFLRRVDEVERADNIWAAAVACNALAIVYPPWFFLWKGGVVGEPSHTILFGILLAVMMIAYFYRKFR